MPCAAHQRVSQEGPAYTGHPEVTAHCLHRPGRGRPRALLHPLLRLLPGHVQLQQWHCGLSWQRPHRHPCQPARDHDGDVSTGQDRHKYTALGPGRALVVQGRAGAGTTPGLALRLFITNGEVSLLWLAELSGQGWATLEGWERGVPLWSICPAQLGESARIGFLVLASFMGPCQPWQPGIMELTSQQPVPAHRL